jgi:hypothetical protein
VQNSREVERCQCGFDFQSARYEPPEEEAANEDRPAHGASARPLRKCAKCGSIMPLIRIERVFINGLIPSGKRFYFQCANCGKEIKVRSVWRLMLTLPGCFLSALFFLIWFHEPNIWIFLFALLLGIYPLVLVFEVLTRIRYPKTELPD